MMRRRSPWKFRLLRGLLIVVAVYTAVLVVWTRVVTARRDAARPSESRMRLLHWEDRLRLPAILAAVPPAFIAAFGFYLPIATAAHEAWLAVVRRAERLRQAER